MIDKKSLVLIGTKNEEEKGVLTIERRGDMLEGRIRLYNFPSEPLGILSIGFYSDGKVEKAGLSRTSTMLYTFKSDPKNINENFSCAVVNISQGDVQPLLYGNTEGAENKFSKLGKVFSEKFEAKKTIQEVTTVLDEKGIDFDDDCKAEIEAEIDKSFCSDCQNCKYKKAFYEKTDKLSDESKEETNLKEKSFYFEIKNQLEKLFESNNKEEFLEEIIPNSKWVKVDYADDGDYYIVGLIYESEQLKYIVYGVPGVYQKNPPKEIAGFPVWFPLDKEKRESFGYWLSYQDAETGESIKAEVE